MTQPHRGLPPPAAMALPSPTNQPSSIGPIPPHIWQSSEETVRSLILLRTEEERRLSEVQKTKQDELRLETRRTEFNMLKEALSSGMPGPLVALMFAGTSNLRGVGSEILQGYIADLQHHQRVQQGPPPPTPELRRETRLIGQAPHHSSGPHHTPMAPPGAAPTWEHQPQPGYQSYPSVRGSSSRSSQSGQSQAPPPPGQTHRSSLPRINTNEIQMQKPGHQQNPMLNPSPMPHSSAQPSTTVSEVPPVTQSPGIYFHHWQPPSSQTGSSSSSAQRAPSPQRQLGSPFPHGHTHLAGSEVSSSPKRRKTLSGTPYSPPYQAAPPPNATPARRRAHSRQRSDTVPGGRGYDPYQRGRQRRSDGGHSQGDEHTGGPPPSEGTQGVASAQPEGGSGALQQGPGQEQGIPLSQQQQQQNPQPPMRPYSAGPDRSRDLPYPGPPGSEGGQPPQGGNGRH